MMSASCTSRTLWACLWIASVAAAARAVEPATAPAIRIELVPGQAESGTIEIHGVAAGDFKQAIWQAGTLHFQPDVRSPLLRPRVSGVFRNIYAPSAVEVPGGWPLTNDAASPLLDAKRPSFVKGWRVFYGAWDGVPTPNDRIYSVTTPDFLDFADRRTEIEHGAFIHVCNVNAIRLEDGSFRMVCTVYPDARGLNKPAFFSSPDGNAWNGSPAPYAARQEDIVEIAGYAPYADADINGVNVILREGGKYRLYFCNWKDAGHVYRASSANGREYRFEGECLASRHAVNDVKRFGAGGAKCYLMGLHANGNHLWYALSNDGMRFEPEKVLATSLGAEDRYIVALGWVAQKQRLFGYLYGAGAVPSLDRNRIFARWLQKKVVITDAGGRRFEPGGSLGPDRQIIPVKDTGPFEGNVEILAEDGKTSICRPTRLKIIPGGIYRVTSGW